MILIRIHLLLFLFLSPLFVMAQSQDFIIENFRENITDLSAVSSNVKDLNGTTAALIRFAVRDTLFEFDPNLGILKQERKAGEVFLYVPQATKRITVRHPLLGILRDYSFPVALQSKVTYDADIRITNQAYLQTLLTAATSTPQKEETSDRHTAQTQKEQPVAEQKTTRYIPSKPDDLYSHRQKAASTPKNQRKPMTSHFLIGAGYQAAGVVGPYASLAISLNAFNLEGGYVLGTSKIESVAIFGPYSSFKTAYDYSANQAWVRMGLDVNPKSKLIVTPQIGFAFNLYNGKELEDLYYSDGDDFKAFFSNSVILALRLQWAIHKNFRLQITPEYHIGVMTDKAYDVVKEADSKFKSSTEGINLHAGIIIRL